MLRTRLCYLILFIIVCLLYVFYVGYLSYFLFLTMLILPILSLILLFLGSIRLQIQLIMDEEQYEKGGIAQLRIRNRTRMVPLAQVDVKLHIHNVFTDEIVQSEVHFTSEYGYSEVIFPIATKDCGKLRFQIKRCKVRDALGIFRFSKKMKAEISTYIMPTAHFDQAIEQWSEYQGDQDYSKSENGNDAYEIFDVHPYVEGDSLHRIHWKLSAKVDEWMIKEGSMPLEENARVIFSLYGSKEQAEKILSHVYGFAQQLLEKGYPFEILQYDKHVTIQNVVITNVLQLDSMMRQCLSVQPSKEEPIQLEQEELVFAPTFYVNHQGVYQKPKGVDEYAHTE